MDNFEDVLNQHKEKARKVYAESGEGNLVNSAMREIESNCADYEYYFQMGQQSKQKRIDELERRLKAVDALSQMRAAALTAFKHEDMNAEIKRKVLILKKAEQALKGGEV
ncbi:hypothetical protein [uncultured Acinetobacter sp.]|uniref:hypothetical protein n=1 Tax=uncultured Acinetobacter sp. TaxID=165433 RepID=UPI00258A64DA|nr:hypothetical protein [uncultured Acinetobacter sp.]